MSAIRFFTDEDVYGATAIAMRKAGFDTVSTPEAGRRAESDESQIAWASDEGRVLITFNVHHFAALHKVWIGRGRHHAGIIVSNQRPIGELLRRLLHLARSLDAEAMQDRLEFLNEW